MRTSLLLLATFSSFFASLPQQASAQIDINKIMQQRQAQGNGNGSGQGDGTGAGNGQGRGLKMEDDTDPFVPNTFTGSYRFEMHTYKGTEEQKNSPMNMRYWLSEDMILNVMDGAGQRGHDVKMLTDLKGKWSYMLMADDKGKKTAMKSRKKKAVVDEATVAKKEPKITVTDETRTIEGHLCTKVIAVNEDGTWTGWVAKDVKSPFLDIMRNLQQRGNDSPMHTMRGVDGIPMEFEWVPTDGKSRMVGYVKDLVVGKVDASVFSLDEYEVMEMPSFGH